MIGLINDIYKVIEALTPLYASLAMGYGSIKWWHMFTSDHCEAISRFVAYFALPFFTFKFTLHIDLYTMNFRLILADTLSKEFRKSSIAVPTVSSGGSSGHVISVESELSQMVVGDGGKVEIPEVNEEVVTERIEVRRISFWVLMKTVVMKLAINPNFLASFLGIVRTFVASRWNVKMPTIIEGCVLIMSKAGTGMAMFSMGT